MFKQAKDAGRANLKRGEKLSYKGRQEIHKLLNRQGLNYKEALDEIKHFGLK